MPGPCFSWAKSISFKAKSITFKSDSGSEISYESRSGSFSSTPLTHPKTPPRRSYAGCTQGCTPSIANLKEMLQGSSTLLGGSHRSSSSTNCSTPSENEFIYRPPPQDKQLKKNKSFLKQHSFESPSIDVNNNNKAIVKYSKENSCIVKGCCECSMHCDGFVSQRNHGTLSPKCFCTKCGESFLKPEALELHQVVRHAGMFLSDSVP